MTPDLSSLAINGGLAFISFLTVFLFNNLWKTQHDHTKRIAKLELDRAVHNERHTHCQCTAHGESEEI